MQSKSTRFIFLCIFYSIVSIQQFIAVFKSFSSVCAR